MKKFTRVFNLLVVALLFVGVMATGSTATAQMPDNISSRDSGLQSLAAPVDYWTPERLAAAIPYPEPVVDAKVASRATTVLGTPGKVEGGAPTVDASGLAVQLMPAGKAPEGSEVIAQGYSANKAPYTRFEVFTAASYPYTYGVYPYITVGKLFFTQYGTDYVCSASSIGNYAIWTAGHCVHAGNNSSAGWSYNTVFVPAYIDGYAPYGIWYGSYSWVKTKWYMKGIKRGLDQDMGGIVLYANASSGYPISSVVGWLGFAWNWSPSKMAWFDIGYPQAYPFDGYRQHVCASSYAYRGYPGGYASPTVGIGCDLTGGSSGGPWIWNFGPSGYGNYVNGHNSYRRTVYTKEMFSPYFNNNAYSLWSALTSSVP